VTETLELVYTGDTTSETLDMPVVKAAKVLITEATFVADETTEMARAKGHTHLREIVEKAPQNELVVLTHFSGKYDEATIVEAIAKLPEGLKSRVLAWYHAIPGWTR